MDDYQSRQQARREEMWPYLAFCFAAVVGLVLVGVGMQLVGVM